MTVYVLVVATVAATGGLLHGMDIAIVGGVTVRWNRHSWLAAMPPTGGPM